MILIKHNTTKWYCATCIHYRLFSQQWEINVDVCKSNLFFITTEHFTRELICQLSCRWHFDCFFPSSISTGREDGMNLLFFAQLGALLQGTYPEGNCWVAEYLYQLEISKWPKLLNAFDPLLQAIKACLCLQTHISLGIQFFLLTNLFLVRQYIVVFDLHT